MTTNFNYIHRHHHCIDCIFRAYQNSKVASVNTWEEMKRSLIATMSAFSHILETVKPFLKIWTESFLYSVHNKTIFCFMLRKLSKCNALILKEEIFLHLAVIKVCRNLWRQHVANWQEISYQLLSTFNIAGALLVVTV